MAEVSQRRSGEFWTERTVAWYERAIARSDYAERVFAAISPLLDTCESALDVGAGCGALALPLARRLPRVTAVEPSAPMVAALRRAVARERADNVSVIEATWENAALAPHDLVICAHVSHLLGRDSPFLAAVSGLARRGVAFIRDAPGGDDKFFFGELYPLLLGRPYGKSCGGEETLETLHDLGIAPQVTVIEYRSDQPFESLDEACDFWMEYMGLAGAEPRASLRAFLAERLQPDDGGWFAPFRKRATVIQWRTA